LARADEDYGVVIEKRAAGRTVTYVVQQAATVERRAAIRKSRAVPLLIERGDYANRMRRNGRIEFADIPIG